MNEPANFVHGSIRGCPRTKYDYPPYKPCKITYDDLFITRSAVAKGGDVDLYTITPRVTKQK